MNSHARRALAGHQRLIMKKHSLAQEWPVQVRDGLAALSVVLTQPRSLDGSMKQALMYPDALLRWWCKVEIAQGPGMQLD